jgi:hypothetical protein
MTEWVYTAIGLIYTTASLFVVYRRVSKQVSMNILTSFFIFAIWVCVPLIKKAYFYDNEKTIESYKELVFLQKQNYNKLKKRCQELKNIISLQEKE